MPDKRISLLIVEDHPGDARLIKEMLTGPAYFGMTFQLSHVEVLSAAIQACSDNHFDVVLLDLNLPDTTGLETLERLNELFPQIPIIVLTGLNDAELTMQSVQHGAQDFVTKEECTSQLLTRVIYYAIERKRIEAQLKHLATHDPLTGLPNRALFYDRLSQATNRTIRKNTGGLNWKAAVMVMDLDHFKDINDNLGHESGDKVLSQLAPRLRACLRQSDTVARLGGDEFAFILEGIVDQADCMFVAQKILKALNEPAILEAGDYSLSASIGISIFPEDAQKIDLLIKYADQAMYAAKRQRDHVRFYKDKS
ncbi:MAG TPA: GGDEF domain-containing response regulator [Anaerolineales bacterium]|nr:GGDEF domain-containing response regulator [Anaerolineales bacterium]